MCGRFTQLYTYAELHAYWSFFGRPQHNFEPAYHIKPTQDIDVVVSGASGLTLARMRWGLVPGWWKKTLKEVPATFNARSETVAEKPMFRSAFKARRCVIPASGWYEWMDTKTGKQPYYFVQADDGIAMIAGLWETWVNPETKSEVLSATMMITEPNTYVSQFHDRMPVLLTKPDAMSWLNGSKGVELLHPPPNDAVKAWPVDRKVNSSKTPSSPDLIKPVKLSDVA